jgi:hypothetical protein
MLFLPFRGLLGLPVLELVETPRAEPGSCRLITCALDVVLADEAGEV